jgi:hypothetical protein
MRTVRNITVATTPNPSGHSPGKSEIPFCMPVNASQPHSLQQLAPHKPLPVQDKYSSISTLKTIISKALLSIPQIAHFNRCTPVKLQLDTHKYNINNTLCIY